MTTGKDKAREQLGVEPRGILVSLPPEVREALRELQREPGDVEYGGGIDFEVIRGKPQVERILAFRGIPGEVPRGVLAKFQEDVEVFYHTHPGQVEAQPSAPDITTFLHGPQDVALIFAGKEVMVMEKTERTPQRTAASFRQLLMSVSSRVPSQFDPEGIEGIQKTMSRVYGIRSGRVPYGPLVERLPGPEFEITREPMEIVWVPDPQSTPGTVFFGESDILKFRWSAATEVLEITRARDGALVDTVEGIEEFRQARAIAKDFLEVVMEGRLSV